VAIAAPRIARQEEFRKLVRPVHDWLQSLQVEFCELVATQVQQARTSVHKPRGLEALEGLEQVVGQVKAGQVLIGGALLTQGLQ